MSVIEKFALISQSISGLMDFTMEDDFLTKEFDNFLKNINEDEMPPVETLLFQFVLNHRIGENHQKVIDYYLEKKTTLPDEEKNIVKNLKNMFTSFFKITKRTKTNFELYNLLNEKTYAAFPLVKMLHFRNVFADQYMLATLFEHDGVTYLIEIKEVYPTHATLDVYRFALGALIANPKLFLIDNKEKIKQVEKSLEKTEKKFIAAFGKNEIVCTNAETDIAMDNFDKLDRKKISEEECRKVVESFSPIYEFKYFKIEDIENNTDSLFVFSLGGFNAHKETYDVGILYISGLGMYLLPFWGTLCKIFEIDDYKTIEGHKECLKNFLNNNSVPPACFELLSQRYSNFMQVVNEILEADYTFDSLMNKYKFEHLEEKIYSSISVLCESEFFKMMIANIEEINENDEDENHNNFAPTPSVGRNDPCPCGSGKKYKKCCLKE